MDLLVVTCVGVITVIPLGIIITKCRRSRSAIQQETPAVQTEVTQSCPILRTDTSAEYVRHRISKKQQSAMESPKPEILVSNGNMDSDLNDQAKDDNSNICKSLLDNNILDESSPAENLCVANDKTDVSGLDRPPEHHSQSGEESQPEQSRDSQDSPSDTESTDESEESVQLSGTIVEDNIDTSTELNNGAFSGDIDLDFIDDDAEDGANQVSEDIKSPVDVLDSSQEDNVYIGECVVLNENEDNCIENYVTGEANECATNATETCEDSSQEQTENNPEDPYTFVEYEVEYTATINLQEGCVENLGVVTDDVIDQDTCSGKEDSSISEHTDDIKSTNDDSCDNKDEVIIPSAVTLKEPDVTEGLLQSESEVCDVIDQVEVGFDDSEARRSTECAVTSSDLLDVQTKANCEVSDHQLDQSTDNHDTAEVDTSVDKNCSHSDSKLDKQSSDSSLEHVKSDSDKKDDIVTAENGSKESGDTSSEGDTAWRTCFRCFNDKMVTMGIHSVALDTFIASSSITLRTLCTNHQNARLKRQNTDPEESNYERDRRAIKIVKMASFDATDHSCDGTAMETMIIQDSISNDDSSATCHVNGPKRLCEAGDNSDIIKDEIQPDGQSHLLGSEPQPIDDVTGTQARDDANNKQGMDEQSTDSKAGTSPQHKRDTVSDSNNVHDISSPDVATLAVLRDLGEKLEFEQQQRKRAEDWSDFLTLELDAQIDARTSTEERHTAMRDRMTTLAAKYRKLMSEHANLVTQIQDLTQDEESSEKSVDKVGSSLRRRNKPSGDPDAIMAKRNAVLIRGSRRQSSSDDSDSVEETAEPNQSNELPNNIEELKRIWEANFKTENEAEVTSRPTNDVSSIMVNSQIMDLSELCSQTNDNDKFVREMAVYNEYATSTPLKVTSSPKAKVQTQTHDKDTCVSKTVSFEQTTKKDSADIREDTKDKNEDIREDAKDKNEDDNAVQVSVKAFTNMWEQKLQKIPFKTVTSTAPIDVCPNPSDEQTTKRMRIRNDEDLKKHMEETAKACVEVEKCDHNANLETSTDSEEDEFFDVEDGHNSDAVVTESIVGTKQALHMWENLSASFNSTSSSDVSKSAGSPSCPPTVIPARSVLQSTTSSGDGEDTSSEVPDFPAIERSNLFSNLKCQWEEKGHTRKNST